jgi:transposase-like protein
MSKHRESWNQEERLRIIQFAAEQGVAKACT